ncbi:hypothetical protein KRR40_18585 [Niabella defluvii]|nr:hypothetical protein KRR40_18585 [Niabella sp. I65]
MASNSDNSYHIMVIELNPSNPQPINNSLVIDGFTFSEGNANAGSVFNSLYPDIPALLYSFPAISVLSILHR